VTSRSVLDPLWLAATFPEVHNLEPVALGGQRWVYRGDHDDEGQVVLKIVKPGQDPERIRREISAVTAIHSSRVPVIHATGVAQSNVGPCVWVREGWIPGTNLAVLLEAGAIGEADLLRLAHDLLTALHEAEVVRIVHRDVKPGNILRGESGAFWLLDFGLARNLDLDSITPTAAQFGVGTFGYSAPEQMRNLKPKIDSRSDLFAAGVTLYEAATGINPFRQGARDHLEMLRRTERLPLQRLRLLFKGGDVLADLVSAMTQKYPDQRPRTIAAALQWLAEIPS